MCVTTPDRKGVGRKQRDESAPLLLFIQSQTPAHGMVLPECRVCLPSPVKPLWKHYPRHTQGCVSQVTPNPVQMRNLSFVFLV